MDSERLKQEPTAALVIFTGALHLFLGPQGETRKRIVTNSTIIDDIAATIRTQKQLPLFVAEGTAVQKMKRINSVPYLRTAYEKFQKLSGTILIFGHSAAPNDIHIYDAIFASQAENVLFCVHNANGDWSALKERLARFQVRRQDIEISYVDARVHTSGMVKQYRPVRPRLWSGPAPSTSCGGPRSPASVDDVGSSGGV